MMGSFFDSNVLLYLLSDNTVKAKRAETLLLAGGSISVQVLAEITSVCWKKFKMDWAAIEDLRRLVIRHCDVHAMTPEIHNKAFAFARTYSYTIYDAQIVMSAGVAGADTLWSEDMQSGQSFARRIDDHGGRPYTIMNPFDDALGRNAGK
jgi:predicted nucleic acid-binding protein